MSLLFRRTTFATVLAGLIISLLIACSPQAEMSTSTSMPMNESLNSSLPTFLSDAPDRVREAYQFAMTNPHELEKYPCYCGCGSMGHLSNLDCYISEIKPNWTFEFDRHASGCGVCVEITQDVKRMMSEGYKSKDIRTFIDKKYSVFGPSTNTPLPVD